MSKYFERQLEELHVQLITLGSYCEKAISFSAKAIQKVQNEEIARQVFETDRDIDAKEREIENLCLSLLLHQHPVARDLREISAALKMVSDMERIGDQAADIADLSLYVAKNTTAIPETITQMAEDTVRPKIVYMLKNHVLLIKLIQHSIIFLNSRVFQMLLYYSKAYRMKCSYIHLIKVHLNPHLIQFISNTSNKLLCSLFCKSSNHYFFRLYSSFSY